MGKPPSNRIPDEKRKAVAADLASGMTRAAVAAKHEISPATASRIATENDIDMAPPPALQAATKAFLANAKERRAQLKEDLLNDVQRLRERAWSQYTRTVAGKDGPYEITEELPPLGEVRNAYAAIGVAITSYTKLEAIDQDTTDDDEAKSLIDKIADGLDRVNTELEAREASGQYGADVPSDQVAQVNVIRGQVVDSNG